MPVPKRPTASHIAQDFRRYLNFHGAREPQVRRATVFWLLNRDGWLTPVWVDVREWSGGPETVRFTNQCTPNFPRAFWVHDNPDCFGFEATCHFSEVCDEIFGEIRALAELARTEKPIDLANAKTAFDFGPQHSQNGWTVGGRAYAKAVSDLTAARRMPRT